MKYVDCAVVPVPKKKLDDYKKLARTFGRLWKEHGALEYVECVAEDVKPGQVTSYPQALKLKRTETAVVAWIAFKSRTHRDRTLAKMMADPRVQKIMDPKTMPFDGMRMFWGGFDVMIKL